MMIEYFCAWYWLIIDFIVITCTIMTIKKTRLQCTGTHNLIIICLQGTRNSIIDGQVINKIILN